MAGTGSKKAGRNKAKCLFYRTMHTREKNKIKRILKSNGFPAAEEYAKQYNMTGWLAGLVK